MLRIIVTESLSLAVFKIYNRPQTFWGHELNLTKSRDATDQVTNRFAIGYFLLIVHNQVSISKRF